MSLKKVNKMMISKQAKTERNINYVQRNINYVEHNIKNNC